MYDEMVRSVAPPKQAARPCLRHASVVILVHLLNSRQDLRVHIQDVARTQYETLWTSRTLRYLDPETNYHHASLIMAGSMYTPEQRTSNGPAYRHKVLWASMSLISSIVSTTWSIVSSALSIVSSTLSIIISTLALSGHLRASSVRLSVFSYRLLALSVQL